MGWGREQFCVLSGEFCFGRGDWRLGVVDDLLGVLCGRKSFLRVFRVFCGLKSVVRGPWPGRLPRRARHDGAESVFISCTSVSILHDNPPRPHNPPLAPNAGDFDTCRGEYLVIGGDGGGYQGNLW